ncbi:hypothetical protein K431DRAFT_120865 [Polychaeton citri CBS 116435]|uniref:Uncharacterized protein n=1 Tax=Polychaeton citri CBS 116435 TaxID=1314669 RepID=A0A9P4Q202_9PEZI|nr:hypothetical protein K431DRAFT_120865 [Polychaeton citri CBS 116435]
MDWQEACRRHRLRFDRLAAPICACAAHSTPYTTWMQVEKNQHQLYALLGHQCFCVCVCVRERERERERESRERV